jgi:hypothetical protein
LRREPHAKVASTKPTGRRYILRALPDPARPCRRARPLLATGRKHSLAQHHEAPVEEIDGILAELG